MKKLFVLLLSLFVLQHCFAQIKWSEDSVSSGNLEWNNYSTSYLGDIDDKVPFLVTAIPYKGMYSNFDEINTPLDLSFKGSLYRFRSDLSDYYSRKLYTFDSSEVYFLALNIYKSNAQDYEYRVVLNATTVIKPWSGITQFSDFRLNKFKEGCGFLGGYKATWGNYIVIELRKKNTDIIFSSAIVYWKEIKPVVNTVYTSKNLNDFFSLLKGQQDKPSKTLQPVDKLVFPSTESTIIFYLTADIFKKEAIEYELKKDGDSFRHWGANDFDNNFIWLKDLPPGLYTLNLRYRAQRHNVTSIQFEVRPQWQQTTAFKIIAGSLIAAFIGFIFLLFRSQKQKQKLKEARLNKEKLQVSLQSIRSQLNPHFIFNALSSIQGLINKNDTEGANKYLSDFSNLLRESLQYNDKMFIPLSIEKRMLDTYLRLEQLRFHFAYNITIAGESLANSEVPGLLIQPLVENAVKHGISGLQEKGTIDIAFYPDNKDLVISIIDNGNGFNISAASNGYGLKLTDERIALLNTSLTDQKIIMTKDSSKDNGTKILLTFKNWL